MTKIELGRGATALTVMLCACAQDSRSSASATSVATSAEGTDDGGGTQGSGAETSSGSTTTTGTTGSTTATTTGTTGSTTGSTTGPGTSSSSTGDSGTLLDVGDGGSSAESGDPGGSCGCVDVEDGIYVMSDLQEIWFYDPQANTFRSLGTVSCPTANSINSMAIDRRGHAYINYWTLDFATLQQVGDIFVTDLANPANCRNSAHVRQTGFGQFGMGYAVDGPDTDCDHLFLFGFGTMELGRALPDTGAFDRIGAVAHPQAELTGTGDGRLYAFVGDGNAGETLLVQYDKSNAAELEVVPLPGLPLTNAFAFAFWGGDFWFFTEATPSTTNSKVTRLDYDANDGGGLSVVNPMAPARILGAGVSTCASVVPPVG